MFIQKDLLRVIRDFLIGHVPATLTFVDTFYNSSYCSKHKKAKINVQFLWFIFKNHKMIYKNNKIIIYKIISASISYHDNITYRNLDGIR